MTRGSSTSNGPREWAEATGVAVREALGSVRRFLVTLTSSAKWQAKGHRRLPDGNDEIINPEVFVGIGFYSRPKDGSRAEMMVVFPGGGASSPTAIAVRDEDLRKASWPDAPTDSAGIFTTEVILKLAQGLIEATSVGGTARELALKSDVATLKTALGAFMTTLSGPGAAPVTGSIVAGAKTTFDTAMTGVPAGTTVFKAE